MNKKVLAIVAVIALVAILGVCLVACNAESYEKKLEKAGYDVEVVEDAGKDAEWMVMAKKKGSFDTVTIVKCTSLDDAKDAEKEAKDMGGVSVYRTGKIVMVGTEQGVKDAK